MGELIKIICPKDLVSASANIYLPASKSISNRLLVMRALSEGVVSVKNLSAADDTKILEKALEIPSGEVHLGLAGTALRFGMAWAAITPGDRILCGLPRLHERPIEELVDALGELGADIQYLEKEGFAPVRIIGKKLTGGKLKIDGSRSSQFLTALMLIAPYCESGLEFEIPENQVSLPYITMTLSLMQKAGANISQEGRVIRISGAYRKSEFTVEPDWSAASYFYLWACTMQKGMLTIKDLHFDSLQGDKLTAEIFTHYGIISHAAEGDMRIGKKLIPDYPSEINCISCPDLAQTFAVAAVIAQKPIMLTGLQTLRHKETDRIEALKNELAKCGVVSNTGSDFIEILSFEKPQQVPVIKTYRDHRMAMAFAPLVAVFGEIHIEDPSVVSKSFPGYWEEVEKMGLIISRE